MDALPEEHRTLDLSDEPRFRADVAANASFVRETKASADSSISQPDDYDHRDESERIDRKVYIGVDDAKRAQEKARLAEEARLNRARAELEKTLQELTGG